MRFLLDSDTASFALRGVYGLSRQTIRDRSEQLYLSWPTETELIVWAYLELQPLPRLIRLREFFSDFTLLPLTAMIQHRYAQLAVHCQRHGLPAAEFDLLIAATALTNDLTLVTHNTRHFSQIPGLRLQDWARPRR
jgi:tRNA(fMet)-specific endonuclease VapC